MSDPISDMLTRIRNAGAAQLPVVKLPHSRIKESAAKILKSEGYVGEVSVAGDVKKEITIKLKFNGKKSVIRRLEAREQTGGLRRYVGSTEIPACAWRSRHRRVVHVRRFDDGRAVLLRKIWAANFCSTFGNPI